MKKMWIVGAITAVAVLGAIPASLTKIAPPKVAQAATNTYHLSLAGTIPDVTINHQNNAAVQRFGVGLDALEKAHPHLDIEFELLPVSPTKVNVTGSGTATIAGKQFVVTVMPQESLDIAVADSGTVYAGALHAAARIGGKDMPVILTMLFNPQTSDAMVNASIGIMGEEVMIAFGHPFLTRQQMEALGPKN